jgi:hypothetical protein
MSLRKYLPTLQQSWACAMINVHSDQAFSTAEVEYLASVGFGYASTRLKHWNIMKRKHAIAYYRQMERIEEELVDQFFFGERPHTDCNDDPKNTLCVCADDKPVTLF